jgi:protein-tyrosine phosphatase
MLNLCFVCLGNICRSPTAEGIMLHLLSQENLSEKVRVDSAGTAAYHVGERPDERSLRTALARGVHLPSVARKWQRADFARFDYVLAMDAQNRQNLLALAQDEAARRKVHLLRSFDPRSAGAELDVPDPYYGEADGFERVFEICEAACRGLLVHLRREHAL